MITAVRVICYISLIAVTYFANYNPWLFLSLIPLLTAYVMEISRHKGIAHLSKETEEKIGKLEEKVKSLEQRMNMRNSR